MRLRLKESIYPLITFVLFILAWQLVVSALSIEQFLLPGPWKVIESTAHYWKLLLISSYITAYETSLGFLLAVAVGLPSAAFIVYSALLEDSLYPILVIAQAVPKAAAAPLILLWLGYGMFPQMIIALLIAFFPVVITGLHGMKSVEPEMLDLARSFNAGGWKIFFKLRLPKSMPHLFSGFKISITLALVGALVGEFVGGKSGLGYLIVVSNSDLNTPLMFAAITASALMGLALFGVVAALERIAIPWYFWPRERAESSYLE